MLFNKTHNAMATFHETGHAKNVANFQDEISFVTGYGAAYNPSKASIKLAALTARHTTAVANLAAVNAANAPWVTAVNSRDALFTPFSKLVTRILNAVQASAVPPEVIDDVRSIARKLTGKRAAPKGPTIPDDPATPEDESQQSISASQMSFDARIENFDKLIQLLTTQAGYVPNEADLTVAALGTLLTNMKAANLAVINAYTTLSNARITRNKDLYDLITGLVTVAADVKAYVKSLFGATSPEYKQISKLKFTRVKV